jgi:hypothetical protein
MLRSQPSLSNGYCGLSTGVKQPGREVKQLLPPSSEVKTEWIRAATPSWCEEGTTVFRSELE